MNYPHIFDKIEQGTDEWFDIRKGCVTASKFKDVMAKGAGKTRMTYMRTLAGEIITGVPTENFQSAEMIRGHALEDEARQLYEMTKKVQTQQVGFVKSAELIGWSPDSLIDLDGGLEIKTKKPPLQIALLEDGRVPSEHMKQVQGGLWVSGRKWMDFMSYWPGLPPFIQRVERDEAMIDEISTAVFMFIVDLKNLVKKIEAM